MLITNEVLTEWEACEDGKSKFNELFPEGKNAIEAIQGLIDANCDGYAKWLFMKLRENGLLLEYTEKGYRNNGDWNSGYRNSGDRNSGDWNRGDRNSGDCNSGDWNSGYRNSGDRNSGDWNSGDWNSGFLNSNTPNTIRVFNKEILLEAWDKAYKPKFLFFNLVFWVSSKDMTEKEKAENPSHETNAGFLRFLSYKEAFKKSWDEADKTDRERIRDLPNFDAEVFFEISGIDLREPKESQL